MIHPPNDPTFRGDLPELILDQRRQLFRLAGQHFLNTARLIAVAVDRDLVTALTFLSIARANLRDLTLDRERALSYGAIDAIPPDSERVPVSVYAVAKELGLPYETVRRHALKLRKGGVCQAVDGGLIVPNNALARPETLAAVVSYWQGTQDFVNAAARAGIVPPPPAEPPAGDVSRQVMRLGVHNFLEVLLTMARTIQGDPLDAMVMRAISMFNVNNVTVDPGLAATYASLAAPPPDDSQRQPISVYAVAKSLMLPYETTRRHVQRLIDMGLAAKVSGGLLVPTAVVARPDIAAGMRESADLSMAFLTRLAELGVGPSPDLIGRAEDAVAPTCPA